MGARFQENPFRICKYLFFRIFRELLSKDMFESLYLCGLREATVEMI